MIGIGYHARVGDGERLAAGPEMLELQVFAIDSLPPLAFPSHRQILSEFVMSQRRPMRRPKAGRAGRSSGDADG